MVKGEINVHSKNMAPFEDAAKQLIAKEQIPGVSLALDEKGTRIYEHGFGYRHVEQQLPVTPDTIFGIASMSKSFTCVALMQLQEAGKLSVHDPVVKYLPNFQVPQHEYTDKITIHHLMTHTSGIPPLKTHVFARKRSIDQDPSAKDYGLNLVDNEGEPIDTFDQLINYLATTDYELLGEPGTEYCYTNDTYGLLGIIIEKVSGQPYEQYIEEHIFKPCGMTRSFVLLDELDNYENVTELYVKKQTENESIVYAAPLWWDAPAMRAAGYIKSTANDILKYLQSFITSDAKRKILTDTSIQEMFKPHVEFERGKFYGYGFRVIPNYIDGCTLINHGGGLKAVSSLMCIIPEKQLTGVTLTNLSDASSDRLLLGAVHQLFDKPFNYSPFVYETKDAPLKTLEKAAGTYESGEGMKVTFVVDGKQLAIKAKGKLEHLQYIDELTFVIPKGQRIVRFIEDDNGNIVRVFYSSRQIKKIM